MFMREVREVIRLISDLSTVEHNTSDTLETISVLWSAGVVQTVQSILTVNGNEDN